MSVTLVWFRRDLRLADHPALTAAAHHRQPIIPVFLWSPAEEGRWADGSASKWWLHHSLAALQAQLEAKYSRLILREGPAVEALEKLVEETGATHVVWSRRYEPEARAVEHNVTRALEKQGVTTESFPGSLLYEPDEVQTRTGGPYKVYTPFSKACLALREPDAPEDMPRQLPAPAHWPESRTLDDLQLLPQIPWDAEFPRHWQPGVAGAAAFLKQFLPRRAADYQELRNRPDLRGTSRISPALHFGELSPRQIWYAVCRHFDESPQQPEQGLPYLRQLLWREFGHHLLYHFPKTPTEPLREEFAAFPWEQNAKHLQAWQRGQTGYPIVDAGMRELWQTGWMHNRVRMIVASFLVKDLLIPWQAGADWFWDTLVDADLANNTLGWQWTAGCGADAAPYFRVFNPVTQGEKFDPDGVYVRRWVPELANLSPEYLHQPWTAPAHVLRQARIEPGQTYPDPIVDHAAARIRALEALSTISAKNPQ